MYKILFLDDVHPALQQTLEEAGFECVLRTKSLYEDVKKAIHLYDGIVLRSRIKIDNSFIEAATNLQFIARAGSGMENIDTESAKTKNIACISAPEGNSNAVAEHLMGMLLSLFNNLNKANNEVKQGVWKREENRGIELKNKTVGIIGYGNTGMAFAKCLKGFGVNVLAYDKHKVDFTDQYVKEVTLSSLKQQSDIISLHIPLTDETMYYINDHFFNSIGKPIYLLNTSRGLCVNTSTLVNQLKFGKILGACLDVLEYEKTSFENLDNLSNEFKYLSKSNRVVLTPHIAGWSFQSYEKISKILAEKIIKVFK